MNWKALGPLLGVILLAALAYAFWPEIPHVPPAPPLPSAPLPIDAPAPNAAPRAVAPAAPPAAPGPALIANTPSMPPPASPAAPGGPLQLDEPDLERLQQLGVPESAIEPADAGPLHVLDRNGIRSAMQEKLPEVKECYESWLQTNPALAGKLKVEFQIVEIPGRERGKVQGISIADGGMGHVAFEGCVKNVFDDLRFEAPKGGEMRVTYPFQFSNTADEKGATP